jgi:hypothetical protein
MAQGLVYDPATTPNPWRTITSGDVPSGSGSPLTTKGDLYGFSSSNARVPVGSDGQVLTADSTQTLGVKWATGSGGGVSSLDSITGAVTLVAGSNVTITDNSPSAGNITIASTGGGGVITQLYNTTLGVAAATIDTGAGGFSTSYNHLFCLLYARTTEASASGAALVNLNNDTGNNYDRETLRGIGTSASAVAVAAQAFFAILAAGGGAAANNFAGAWFAIPSYANTVGHKVLMTPGGFADATTGNSQAAINAGRWRSTAAVNRITLTANASSNFVAGTQFTVYGLL